MQYQFYAKKPLFAHDKHIWGFLCMPNICNFYAFNWFVQKIITTTTTTPVFRRTISTLIFTWNLWPNCLLNTTYNRMRVFGCVQCCVRALELCLIMHTLSWALILHTEKKNTHTHSHYRWEKICPQLALGYTSIFRWTLWRATHNNSSYTIHAEMEFGKFKLQNRFSTQLICQCAQEERGGRGEVYMQVR